MELLQGRDGRDGEPGRDGRDGMPGAQGLHRICKIYVSMCSQRFGAVMLMLMVHCSTMLRPAALACLALLMMLRKSSIVLFVQSENLP